MHPPCDPPNIYEPRFVGSLKKRREVETQPSSRPLQHERWSLHRKPRPSASLPDDVEGLYVRIAQYEHMLDRAGSEPKQRVVAQLLRDAEDKLKQIRSQQPTPRPNRVAAA
jgi:hypothetical protein